MELSLLKELSQDLVLNITIESIMKNYNDYCLTMTNSKAVEAIVSQLGSTCDLYDNLVLAGRLHLAYNKTLSPKTLNEYLNVMVYRMNTECYQFMRKHCEILQEEIDDDKYASKNIDWFSANTLIKTYFCKKYYQGPPVDTIHTMWLRVACQCFYRSGITAVINAFRMLCQGLYTPGSPVIFNSSLKVNQLSSCFLGKADDDMKSIITTAANATLLTSKTGATGIEISDVRCSEIGVDDMSHGIVPFSVMFNSMISYADQRGKRNGVSTLFLSSHHLNLMGFIDLTEHGGTPEERARKINTCISTCYLFWKRYNENGNWTLFCPAKTKQLKGKYGREFEKLYIEAENDNTILSHHKKVISARKIMEAIREVSRQSSRPYLINNDAIHIKSNQRRLIDDKYSIGGNLCLEIYQRRSYENMSSCNLHTVSLSHIVAPGCKQPSTLEDILKYVKFMDLGNTIKHCITSLDNMIDVTFQLEQVKYLNEQDRSIAVGVTGFAEMIYQLDMIYDSALTIELNKVIFASMYFAAISQSIQLAIARGIHPSFPHTEYSRGKFQFDLWAEEFDIYGTMNDLRKKEDDEPISPNVWKQEACILKNDDGCIDVILPTWDDLRRCMIKYGMRNSHTLTIVPSASTAHIRRDSENTEVPQSNLYSRRVVSASYIVMNRFMFNDLFTIGCWNKNVLQFINMNNGSLAPIINSGKTIDSLQMRLSITDPNIDQRLNYLIKKYATIWDTSQKHRIKLAAHQGRYIDQGISLNLYFKDADPKKVSAAHLYSFALGNKTIVYISRQGSRVELKSSDSSYDIEPMTEITDSELCTTSCN